MESGLIGKRSRVDSSEEMCGTGKISNTKIQDRLEKVVTRRKGSESPVHKANAPARFVDCLKSSGTSGPNGFMKYRANHFDHLNRLYFDAMVLHS